MLIRRYEMINISDCSTDIEECKIKKKMELYPKIFTNFLTLIIKKKL
jgi:hypothetical protein